MKLINLLCNSCNATLELDVDKLIAFCPYCGQKLLFDLEQMEHVLIEKEKTLRFIEQEQTKRMKNELDYKKSTEDRKSEQERILYKSLPFILLITFGFMFLLIWLLKMST